jgi:hypothetical protein
MESLQVEGNTRHLWELGFKQRQYTKFFGIKRVPQTYFLKSKLIKQNKVTCPFT